MKTTYKLTATEQQLIVDALEIINPDSRQAIEAQNKLRLLFLNLSNVVIQGTRN